MLHVYEEQLYVDREARDAANRPLIVINPTIIPCETLLDRIKSSDAVVVDDDPTGVDSTVVKGNVDSNGTELKAAAVVVAAVVAESDGRKDVAVDVSAVVVAVTIDVEAVPAVVVAVTIDVDAVPVVVVDVAASTSTP